MLMPAAGDSTMEGASFARLVVDLAALALERFDAARANRHQDPLRERVSSRLVGVPVDPFDGQLLRFREADTGYQLHSVGHHVTATPVRERDPGVEVIDSKLL